MQQTWQRLPLEGHEACPTLYISYNIDSKGYEVFLTDLVHVWSEFLNRRQILANALKYETSIDSSQDDDQYSVLLQKIGEALGGKEKTTLSLYACQDGDILRILTETKLPLPLDPLTWTFNLSKLPQNAFAKQVFLPVLRGAATYEARTQSLIEKLKEKDWALGKLFDKLESSGIDLSTVFPSLTGMRKHGRKASAFSQASKLIKGVAPFEESTWNSEFTEQNPNDPIDESIIREFSGFDGPSGAKLLGELRDDWWAQVRESQHAATSVAPVRKAPPKKERKEPAEEVPTESEDEFEIRETPPRARKSNQYGESDRNETDTKASPAANRRESTASSEDGANSPVQSPPPQRQKKQPKGLGMIGFKASTARESTIQHSSNPDLAVPPEDPRPKVKGLGTIGGRKFKISKADVSPARNSGKSTEVDISTNRSNEKPSPHDESTESEAEEDVVLRPMKLQRAQKVDDEDSDQSVTTKRKSPTKPRVGGLGQIGGRKRKETPKEESSKQSTQSIEQDAEASLKRAESHSPKPKPAKRSNKLGMIGGRSARTQAASQSQSDKRSTAEQNDISTTDEMSDKEEDRSQTKPPDQVEAPTRSITPSSKARARARSSQKEEPKPTKEETPEERANRKREELRRQLESKSGPVKKKRRF